MEKRKRIIIMVLLLIAVVNFSRLKGSETIRTVEFVSIFVIGGLSALLISDLIKRMREK